MTRYTVVWDKEVEAAFLNAWIAGNSFTRTILTEVAIWVDNNLATDAETKGHAHSDPSTRSIDVPIAKTAAHISALFQVLPDDQQVRVLRFIFKSA